MDSTSFVLLSGALTFGVPLLLAMRELKTLGPGGGGGRGPDADDPAPAPLPPDGPVVETMQKPLPDCLIPKPLPLVTEPAERELELA